MRNRRKHVEILRRGKVIGKYVTVSLYLLQLEIHECKNKWVSPLATAAAYLRSPQGKPQQASQVTRLMCSGREHIEIQR